MNDYLNRAVDREVSGIPAVRPALPSLFDYQKASAIATAREPENAAEGEPSRNARSETRAEDPATLQARLAAVDALWTDAAAIPGPPRIAEVTAGKTSARVVATPSAPATGAESRADSRSLTEQSQPAEVVVRPTVELPPGPLLVPALEQVAEPVTQSLVNRRRPISESGGDSPSAPIPRSTIGDTKAKSEAPPALASKTPAVRPVVPTVPQVIPAPSRSERAANSRAARGDASSPRAIHITIGRIEVRAVHPPPEPLPQPRPAPVSPKISLEEYLKQRNGDRR